MASNQPTFKMRKFSGIPSRVLSDLQKEKQEKRSLHKPMSSFGPRDLNRDALTQFDKNMPAADIDEKFVAPSNENSHPNKPPRTPNYGKTPKYLQKYKEER